jgi:hypothetical protein
MPTVDKGGRSKASIAEKCFNRVLLMVHNQQFFDDVVAIKHKHGIPEKGLVIGSKIITEDFYKYLKDIGVLRVKYNLSELHMMPLIWLIVFANSPREDLDRYINHLQFRIEPDGFGQNVLYLAIYPEMGIKDIQSDWQKIAAKAKEVYGYEHGNQKLRKKLIRDYCINYFRKSGVKPAEIAKTIKEFYGYGANFGYETPPVIINQLKKDADNEVEKLTKSKKLITD